LIDQLTARHALTAPTHWRHTVHPTHAPSARACAHLLFHRDQRQRPEGLLISDDNLVDEVLAGLADADVRVGRDVDVIVHANFPSPLSATSSGVYRLGYDARATLVTCVEFIDAQRSGRQTTGQTLMRAVFDNDKLG
jgi:DNA-binding LacI/PurR family transcriptional regulator